MPRQSSRESTDWQQRVALASSQTRLVLKDGFWLVTSGKTKSTRLLVVVPAGAGDHGVGLGLEDEYDAPGGIVGCARADRQVAAGGTCTSYLFEFPTPPRYNPRFM
jgi:hypothetical protein